ncbi:sodium:solute symporter family transporter [Craterilacuibacter sp.]|uniref:sodium:solute symporter family transporter n=1 Tax=Craterilacuibacter sp. TaxID=2870909 RepID=UPI003F316BFA
MNTALLFFLPLFALTLWVCHLAARRTQNAGDFFSAGKRISARQNALALAGDYLSAAAFLGAAGLYFGAGYDSLAYAVGTLAGWPLLMQLLAGRLRQLGCFTVSDVLAQRFASRRLRAMSALSSLTVTVFYLIVQMVGAGKLLELLFGLPYLAAVALVALLMVAYVAIGGMLATTWVQMIKAVLLLLCGSLLAVLVLARFGYSVPALFDAAVAVRGEAILLPGKALSDPVEVLSLGLGLTLGLLGLPHVLMRFLTVADARAARHSAAMASLLVGGFFCLNIIIGYGAIALLPGHAAFFDAGGKLVGGGNMAVLHLATLLGGAPLAGLLAAVAFATILAVVSGLTLAGAAAISHDLWAGLQPSRTLDAAKQRRVSRYATLALGAGAVLLSTLFQQQNIAFLLGLAFAIAAAANFPVLLLALYWPRLSTTGALACGLTGMLVSTLLIILGPAVWVAVLGFEAPIFPWSNPALFAVPLAFAAGFAGSRLCPGTPNESTS